jgi:hypothetical protein
MFRPNTKSVLKKHQQAAQETEKKSASEIRNPRFRLQSAAGVPTPRAAQIKAAEA